MHPPTSAWGTLYPRHYRSGSWTKPTSTQDAIESFFGKTIRIVPDFHRAWLASRPGVRSLGLADMNDSARKETMGRLAREKVAFLNLDAGADDGTFYTLIEKSRSSHFIAELPRHKASQYVRYCCSCTTFARFSVCSHVLAYGLCQRDFRVPHGVSTTPLADAPTAGRPGPVGDCMSFEG